jgi:glycosyltransferase involved in cell wall biosynthesis
MKIIVCGPVFNEKVENMLIDASPAAGRFLCNLIEGFNNNNCEVLKAIFITYATQNGMGEKIISQYSVHDNIVLKSENIFDSVITFRRRLVDMVSSGDVVVFYNMSYAYLGLEKKIFQLGGKPLLILADHTTYREQQGFMKKILSILYEKEYVKFRKVVALSENIGITFKSKTDMKVIHGGIRLKDYENFHKPSADSKIIVMYAGLLSKVTGVDKLLKAISMIKQENIEIWISGKGEMESQVVEMSQKDKRVKFLGYLPINEYLLVLSKCNILVNPRNMDLEQNNNNFPSKVLDYLATGRIIVSSKFSGYEEFINHIIFYNNSSTELASAILNVIENYSGYSEKYFDKNRLLAKEFDWTVQARKMIEEVEKN